MGPDNGETDKSHHPDVVFSPSTPEMLTRDLAAVAPESGLHRDMHSARPKSSFTRVRESTDKYAL